MNPLLMGIRTIVTTSGHFEWASTMIKNIFSKKGFTKSLWTRFQWVSGQAHGCRGATDGEFWPLWQACTVFDAIFDVFINANPPKVTSVPVTNNYITYNTRKSKRSSNIFWKKAGADATPKGSRVYRYRPWWVLMVMYEAKFLSSGSCKYACDNSSFEKTLPPTNVANKLSGLGSGHCSIDNTWLTVTLYNNLQKYEACHLS